MPTGRLRSIRMLGEATQAGDMTEVRRRHFRRLIQWLLDSDPAIRWQTMQALLHSPAEEVAAERVRVATEGWGAKLLAMQGADGTWGGEAWNHGWDSTMHVLTLLREFGLDPASDQARRSRTWSANAWRGAGGIGTANGVDWIS